MVERPPPPDLPTRQPVQPPPFSWRGIRRSSVAATVAIGLLIYEAVFDKGPVDPTLVAAYVVLIMSPPAVAANELAKRYLAILEARTREVDP